MDPLTALSAATAAFSFIKKGIQTGKELEGMVKQLGVWFDAVGAIRQKEQDLKNPPLFKKLLFSGSIEQEALELLVQKKQIEQQERELRELITYRYGVEAYKEMLMMRRQIKSARAAQVVAQRKRIKNLIYQTTLWGLLIALLGGLGILLWFTWKLFESQR